MEEHVGIKRDQAGLTEGIEKLEAIRDRLDDLYATGPRKYNAGWQTCFDLVNMVDVGLAIAHAARERTESRGAHSRIDHPEPDDELGGTKFTVALEDGSIELSSTAVPEPRPELKEMLEADTPAEDEA
jgi:succinate dehydrogenase / fumarate reductase flavoprotein subunit